MKIGKINKILLLTSIVAIVFDLVRVYLWGKSALLYLILNLFLAWIPYFISSYFFKRETSVNRFIPFFIFWLLFFPNAPYLVTDVLHITSSLPSLVWYDSLLFFLFGWLGLLLGILSLFQVHQYFKSHLSYRVSEILIFSICFISSLGVYLGRFERWNSWDVFINPLELIKHSFNLSTNLMHTGVPLMFVIVFTVFLYIVYRTMYILLMDKIE